MKININLQVLFDIINLKNKIFHPVTNFMGKREIESVAENFIFKSKIFFPLPISFSTNQKKIYEFKHKKIRIFYKNKFICNLIPTEIFSFNKKENKNLIKKIYGTDDKLHPGVKFFLKNKIFIKSKIYNFNSELLQKYKSNSLKKKINNNKCVGFHTRNVIHKGHQHIQNIGIQKYGKILISPMVGQFKKNEYKMSTLIRVFKTLENQNNNKNILFNFFWCYPRYGGPREAAFHAIARKNMGCTHFIVGRDHAGIGKYYSKYESQNFCKKNQGKLGIKIVATKEPFYCKTHKKIVNKACSNKIKKCFLQELSGSLIRKKIVNNKTIPNYLMEERISKLLNKNDII